MVTRKEGFGREAGIDCGGMEMICTGGFCWCDCFVLKIRAVGW
jgi:hypothetical protein